MQYTKSQQKAIKSTDQNLQIIACAGSGKTEVISARVVEILKHKNGANISPVNIVAFTFTDKAAAELKDRIHRLCKKELGSDLGLAEMFVGTIHGYCLNLLQSPPVYKLLKYSVLNEVQQRLLIDRNSGRSGLTHTPLLNGGKLKRWTDSRLYQQLLGIIGEGTIKPESVPIAVREAVEMYHALITEKKYLDYTSIIARATAELNKNDALRSKISAQVKYLVVDEYQDINPLQENLIRLIHSLGANICVVGDDDQTIYQWRGSDVENIIKFSKRYPKVKEIPLNENFRSSKGIVMSARHVVEKNPERLPKKMESTEAQPYKKGDILALSFRSPKEEARWIAEKICYLYKTPYRDKTDSSPRGQTYSDFAILLRSVQNDAEPILSALYDAQIPYVVGGINGLFDTLEIGAIRDSFFFLADYVPNGTRPVTTAGLKKTLLDAGLGITEAQVKNGIALLKNRKSKIGREMDAELYLQRVYLDFLASLELIEENVDKVSGESRSGEIVFYNLGKFSQLISDYEQINFNTAPVDLYPAFAAYLYYQAPHYYPEGWLEQGNAKPDAVQIMTVHQAKGMQWPAVFVPCLRNNRFPSRRQGGRSVWHIIPEESVGNSERYKGTKEDERRLFYVALTRAEKYLYCTWAPIAANLQQRNVSDFLREFTGSEYVLTKDPKLSPQKKILPKPRKEDLTLPLTFSELKYYFECPYLFKLRFLYGFDIPISRALGYGKSIHDALSEIHAESLKGHIPKNEDIIRLVEDHLHLPFANPIIAGNLRRAALKALGRYLEEHRAELKKLEHVEKIIELKLDEGIVVSGRIDLIRKTDTDEIVIVDFKSDERAQEEDITQKQLHIYAVGYKQLTGKRADLIEVHNLDKGGAKRELIDDIMMKDTLETVVEAGKKLRENKLPRLSEWGEKCERCELSGVCRKAEK